MSIIRAPRKATNFYILDKSISEDSRLTWAARGLLIFLLGKPDHWRISPAALRNETSNTRKPTGRDGVYSLLDELISAGYVTRIQERQPDGTLSEINYMVSESPLPALPYTAQPYPVKTTQVRNEGSKDLEKGRKEERPAQNLEPVPAKKEEPPPPPFEKNEQPEQPLNRLIRQINAQRANNGKQPYTPTDLAKLNEQAHKASISPEQAAEWVLERPTRNFFQATYYTTIAPAPVAPVAPPTPVAPPPPVKTPEEMAVITAAAKAARENLRKIVKEMRTAPPRKKQRL
jgi:hypothetical protein